MTLKVRRILSLLFIVFFLTISPVIILYAAGYKLKRNGFSIQRTGMFIIETKPKGAKIYINDKPQKTFVSALFGQNNYITTPAKIKNLLPGEYDLTLVLDGYASWHKKLIINPGASTFIKDVYLFKNSLPMQISPLKIKRLAFSPEKNLALAVSSNELYLVNLLSETDKLIKANLPPEADIFWSNNNLNFIAANSLYNLDDLSRPTDLEKITPNPFAYRWQGDDLYYRDQTSIFLLQPENQPKKIIADAKFNDYLIKGEYLFLVDQTPNNSKLIMISLNSLDKIKEISLPSSGKYAFINPDHFLINLYDQSHETLYLINPSTDYLPPLVYEINRLKNTFWSDEQNLIYTNDFEIWQFNLTSRERTLITRISDRINRAVVHPNKKYIFYSTDQSINTIELDEREKRNIAELVKFDQIGSFSLNHKGDTLYFSGSIGNSAGLYKLSIQ